MSYKASDVGFQGQSDVAGLGSASSTSASYVDIGDGATTGFSTYTFVATKAKVYLVYVDLSAYMSVTTGSLVGFQLLKDGNSVYTLMTCWNLAGEGNRVSFIAPVTMAVGNNVLKLQWKTNTGTLNVSTSEFRCFTVVG